MTLLILKNAAKHHGIFNVLSTLSKNNYDRLSFIKPSIDWYKSEPDFSSRLSIKSISKPFIIREDVPPDSQPFIRISDTSSPIVLNQIHQTDKYIIQSN